MVAHMIVRSTVPEVEVREAFDRWYGEEHVAQAVAMFHPSRCWRSWSTIDPSVHYANYEFENVAEIEAMMAADTFKEMVAAFTRMWEGKVTRERDVTVAVQIV
jgi:hypothetical protein